MEENHRNDAVFNLQDFDDESDDELSLCDLPIDTTDPSHLESCEDHNNTTSDLDLFEFFVNNETTSPTSSQPIVFCGKTIPAIEADPKTRQYHIYRHPSNGLFIRRDSFKRSRSFRSESVKSPSAIVNCVGPSKPSPVAVKSPSAIVNRVGQSKTSPVAVQCGFRSGGKSRRHKVLIGLVKLQPEMDMSEIRRRQNRRSPTAGYGKVDGATDTFEVRPLRLRSYLLKALTMASFRCMQHV